MDAIDELKRCYDRLLGEAMRMAGGLNDLKQRAAVYHHLFEDSGRNHVFPLIAAHGALWARGYFAFGMKLAGGLAWQYPFSPDRRRRQLARVAAFADAFREVNRRVCVDTYASYHFTARYGDHPGAARFVAPPLLAALNRVHAARRAGVELADADKRDVFEAHFRNEQQTVVGPGIDAAVAAFDWPLVKRIALSPIIRFAYFPDRRWLWFRRFDRREERIANGLRAFDLAAQAGWDRVESSLRAYDVLPASFFAGSARHFANLRETVLAGG